MIAASTISGVYDSVLALVYPQPCEICGDSVESRHDGVVCGGCWQATEFFTEDNALCWKCGAVTRAAVSPERRQSIRCGRCDDEAFTAARACGFYEGGLRASVLALKREPRVAARLAQLMLTVHVREPINAADLIIPVPLHADREKARRFNQAALLAGELAKLSGLPCDEFSFVRRTHTERHRAGMDGRARRDSVAGAFAVRHAKLISGRRVLLVDDVFTTGATVSACASVLREAGAEEVFVLTIARARTWQ